MHPNYVQQLENLRAGRTTTPLPVGAQVRLVVPGDHNGSVGTIVKSGRTSYHVQLDKVRLRVLFAGVELARAPETDRREPVSLSQPIGSPNGLAEQAAQAVATSLMTADGRFRTLSATGEQRHWRAAPHDHLRAALFANRAFKHPSADDARLMRRISFLDVANDALVVPLARTPEEATSDDILRFQLSADDSDGPAWEDWFRVDRLLRELAQAAWQEGSYLSLSTESPNAIRVRCLAGRTEGGQESIFIHTTHRPPNDSVQGHDVWQRAVRRGSEFVLEAPLTDDMMGAAGRLMMVALRAQGLSPLSVFPSEVVMARPS
jgi:hypothetical protein